MPHFPPSNKGIDFIVNPGEVYNVTFELSTAAPNGSSQIITNQRLIARQRSIVCRSKCARQWECPCPFTFLFKHVHDDFGSLAFIMRPHQSV